jgi:hypothetical protein
MLGFMVILFIHCHLCKLKFSVNKINLKKYLRRVAGMALDLF